MKHLSLLLRLMPQGLLDLFQGPVEEDLAVSAHALDLCWQQRDELMKEQDPAQASVLLPDWERIYQLNRTAGKTDDERRAVLLLARRRIHDFRPSAIADYMSELLTVTAVVQEVFPLTFYVQADAATLAAIGAERAEADEHIESIKPAHTQGLMRTTAFITNSGWSLTNFDLLGA